MNMHRVLTAVAFAVSLCSAASSSVAAPRYQPRVSRIVSSDAFHEDYRRQYASVRPGRLTDLVGDTYSGVGFYPLPRQYRASAERYGRYRVATNAIRYAALSQAIETPYFLPVAGRDYRYGVFNPNDGVGTPFFAGYYAN